MANREELINLANQLQELNHRYTYRKRDFYFPTTGQFPRDMYPKHVAWMDASKNYCALAIIGANGTGKTLTAGCAVSDHLTGQYPAEYKGRKFSRPIKVWVSAINIKQLKAGIQNVLFGSYTEPGTGLIPRENLLNDAKEVQVWAMAGGVIGSARIRHYTNGIFDGWSEIQCLTYEQGWESFQGFNADIMWMDEDPKSAKIVSEATARTRGPKGQEGLFIYTGVQLNGRTPIMYLFCPDGKLKAGANEEAGTYVEVLNIWSDAPHISEEWKTQQLQKLQISDPNSIAARMDGLCAAGAGRVYPFRDDQVIVPMPKIGNDWKRVYGLDPGWRATAAIWIAEDPYTKVKYIYGEYQEGEKVDAIHVAAIRGRGEWIPGGLDPHGGLHRDTNTGLNKISHFTSLGLNVILATGDKTVIRNMILGMFESGMLKIVDSCTGLIDDLHNLVYDENRPDKVADKQSDHRPDAMEYALAVFDRIAQAPVDMIGDLIDGRSKDSYTEYDNDSDTGC